MKTPSNPDKSHEETIYAAALALGSPSDRAAYLQMACGNDAALRQRVDAMLHAESRAEAFFQVRPADPEAATRLDGDPTPAPQRPPADGVGAVIGRYKLLERLGEGGCGVVYVAEQTEPVRRRVALKVIRLGMDTESVIARFEAERQALALMEHPNIAKLLDAGVTGPESTLPSGAPSPIGAGRPYFVMELVRGLKITDYCDQNNLSTRERLDVFIQVCHAVQHAHEKGVIHRDIKPSNVLVTLHDGVPVPKVIDFGIAKATEGRLADATVYTQLHQFIGTPAYMSPEQAEMSGLDLDTRSDIYSLGVLLYELLTGTTPFEAAELMKSGVEAMRRTIREQEPPRPSTRLATLQVDALTTTARRRSLDAPGLIHQVRGDLDWIAMKSLEKDRNRRYESADGLALDIQRYLRDQPVSAVAPSLWYRLEKFSRRHRKSLLTAAAVGALVAVGVAVNAGLARRAQRAELARVGESRKVQEATSQLAETLGQQEQVKIAETFAKEGPGRGLAQLARALRQHPESPRAAVHLLSVLSHRDIARLVATHSLDGRLLHFCHGPLGPLYLTLTNGQDLLLWNVRQAQPVAGPLHRPASVLKAQFAPSGRWFAAALTNGTVEVWNTTNTAAGPWRVMAVEKAGRLEFAPDESRLLVEGTLGTGPQASRFFQVWDLPGNRALTQPQQHEGLVAGAMTAFAGNGSQVVIREFFGLQRARTVFDIATGAFGNREAYQMNQPGPAEEPGFWDSTQAGRTEHGVFWSGGYGVQRESLLPRIGLGPRLAPGEASDVDFNVLGLDPDRQELMLSLNDGFISLWDVSARAAIPLRFTAAATEPDGSYNTLLRPVHLEVGNGADRVLTLDGEGTARVWDPQSGKPVMDPVGELRAVVRATLSRDGNSVATAETNGWIRVWETRRGQPVSPRFQFPVASNSTNPAAAAAIVQLAFDPSARRVAAGRRDGSLGVWDATSAQPLLQVPPTGFAVQFLLFSEDGTRLARVTEDHAVQAWDLATGKPLGPAWVQDAAIAACEFSPDGTRLATAAQDQTVRTWEISPGRSPLPPFRHQSPVQSVQWMTDGATLVSVTEDRTLHVWEMRDGRALHTHQPVDSTHHLLVSRVGGFAAAIGYEGIELLDPMTGTRVSERIHDIANVMAGLDDSPACLSADGRHLAGVSGLEVRIWELPRPNGPAPEWLPRLAEAVAGVRLNAQGILERAPLSDLAEVRQAVLNTPSNDDYGRWGRWFFAERDGRTIAPSASTTLQEHLDRCARANTEVSLAHALNLDPTNRVLLAALLSLNHAGLSWKNTILSTNGGQRDLWSQNPPIRSPYQDARMEAQRLRGMADEALRAIRPLLDLKPVPAIAWEVQALALHHLGQHAKAVEALDRIAPDGASRVAWSIRGLALEQLGRMDEADKAFARAIEVASLTAPRDTGPLAAQRARFSIQQGRPDAAAQALCLARGIPVRSPIAKPHLIDLSLHYTSSLTNLTALWHTDRESDTFQQLPTGVHRLGATEWDIRGLITHRPAYSMRPDTNFAAVPIGQRCRALHFLHGASGGISGTEGESCGRYRVRFANGQTQVVPILLGTHVRDWFYYDNQPLEAGEAAVAWVGTCARDRNLSFVRLYDMEWVNPFPDVEIAGVDLQLASATGAVTPFLVALTVDPATAGSEAHRAPESAVERTTRIRTTSLGTLDAGLARQPDYLPYLLAKAGLLERMDRPAEALAMLTGIIESKETQAAADNPVVTWALGRRSTLLRKLNRPEEAQADLLRSRGIPVRAANAPAELVNLDPHYNAGLRHTWNGDTFPDLAPGVNQFAGTAFDVRGLVQLNGQELARRTSQYPERVDGLRIGRKLSRFHVLHAVAWTAKDGEVVAEWVLHFADGQTRTIPVVYGEDVRDWWIWPQQPERAKRASVVWKGANAATREAGATLCLFKSTWENPRPDVAVARIDYVSRMTASAPLLVGLTVEP